MNTEQAAAFYASHGLSIIPTNPKDKRPFFAMLPDSKWEMYKHEIASTATIKRWFGNGSNANIAIIGGAVSGGLLCIDFDVMRFYDSWIKLVGELADGLVVQRTGKGMHVIFRCPEPGGNDKLAYVPDDNEKSGRLAAIETRGSGGYFQVYPTIHENGNQYTIVSGSLSDIPVISQARCDALLAAARKLDEAPKTRQQIEAEAKRATPARRESGDGDSVIDAYNAAYAVEDILESNNYKARGNGFVRPDGTHVSVYIYNGKSYHYNSNDPLCDGHLHDAFDVFCCLGHGSDIRAAVRAAAELLGMDKKMSSARGTTGKKDSSAAGQNWHGEVDAEAERARIKVNARSLDATTKESLDALYAANDPPVLFVRSGAIARIVVDENKCPKIESMNENAMRGRLARVATFYRVLKDGTEIECDPPMSIVRDIMGLGEWNFPALQAIVETPALRTDGTLIKSPGYDMQSALYYHPADGLKIGDIPDYPTDDDVSQAVALLNGIISDFPFADDASKANAMALLLTPVLRPAISGCVPLAVIDAPQAGTGKSLLTSTTAVVATGRDAAFMTAPKSSEEWNKKITTALLDGAPVILIDNVSNLFSDHLASALTARKWRDRLLGKHETILVPQRATWIANGNNIRLNGDLPRRCYWIRLDAKMSRPWQRGKFQYKLPDWALENRGMIVSAALTIARAWWASGKQPTNTPVIGGFTEWAEIVGGILNHAGISGFLGNLDLMYENADDDTPQWEAFLLALSKRFQGAITTNDICSRLETDHELVELLPDTFDSPFDRDGKVTGRLKKRMGKALAARNGKRFGESQVNAIRIGNARNGAITWKIVHSLHSMHSLEHPTPHEKTGGEDLYINNENGESETMQTLQSMQDGNDAYIEF